MRFYRLLEDVTIRKRIHIGRITSETGAWLHFMTGTHMATKGNAEITVPGPLLRFFFSSFSAPLAARDLAVAMQRLAPGDIDVVELSLPQHPDLVALNILRIQRCVDDALSDFVRFDETDSHRPDLNGTYKFFTKLAINVDSVDRDAHIFRLADWKVGLIVSDTMRQCMLDAGCRGAEFQLVTP